ncbi:MAG: RluA family pseudouridine synthase [Clostridiales bacterium]|nr:RluA family pseudouridine synthase [Clostridiales bacterium]
MDEILIESSEYEEREALFTGEDEGSRLDAALAARFPDLSRSRIQSIIESGLVRPEGLTKNTRVKAGDRVYITVNERVPLAAGPEDITIFVVYEDQDLLVVDKERGMVVHPAKGSLTGTLVNALLGRFAGQGGSGALSGVNGAVRPGIVHRIDKNTSGLLVVAKNDAAHTALAGQFAAHTITRRYLAIAAGGFSEEEGTIDAAVGRDPKNRMKQAILPEGGKRAVTHWRVVERLSGSQGVHTLLELTLETGRTHQIRVHLAGMGHPVLGDDLYGPARGPGAREGQYLHAGVLGFDHPSTGGRLEFESPLPPYFTRMLERLGQPGRA